MPRIVHFEFQSPQPQETLKFFRDVFGWEANKFEGGEMPYWLLSTGPQEHKGIDGGLMPAPDGQARTVCVLEVGDVDVFTKKAQAAGGQVVVPKMPIPGVGWVAYATDPHGVLFGIYKHDESAK